MKKCDWCEKTAEYTVRLTHENVHADVCHACMLHATSELGDSVNTVELDPEPENAYETLERFPEGATREYTVWELSLAHRYGTPCPVSGDHTSRTFPAGLLLEWDTLSTVAMGTHEIKEFDIHGSRALQSSKNPVN